VAEKRIASPGYFDTLGVHVIAGRAFDDHDTAGSPPVMVVSEAFAKRYFENGQAVGKHASFNWDMPGEQEIIGVVSNVKHYGLDDAPLSMVYVSYLQRPLSYATFVVKASGDSSTIASSMRGTIRSLDADRPLERLELLSSAVDASVSTRRFVLIVAALFAILAAILALTGVYSVVSYTARQRTREFAIRLALGARPGDLVQLALGQGLWPTIAGLAIGMAAAVPLSRVVRAQLFGVTPTDGATYGAIAAGLAAVALAACYLPARRVLRLNAATAMRQD
jgi:predicted permease